MKIEIEYNTQGNHEATATAGEWYCTCNGLAGCGEPFFDSNFTRSTPEELKEEMESAALKKVRGEWDYDGSNWSEPVDEPESTLTDEPDDEHQWEIRLSDFHGGAVVGYAESEEEAEYWVEYKLAGDSCTCGCYEIRELGLVEIED